MNLSDYPRTQEAGYAEPIIARGFAPDVADPPTQPVLTRYTLDLC